MNTGFQIHVFRGGSIVVQTPCFSCILAVKLSGHFLFYKSIEIQERSEFVFGAAEDKCDICHRPSGPKLAKHIGTVNFALKLC